MAAAQVAVLNNVWTQGEANSVSFFTSETFSTSLYATFSLRQEGNAATNVQLCAATFYDGRIECPPGVTGTTCRQAVCSFNVDRGQAPAANYFVEVQYQDCFNLFNLPSSCKNSRKSDSVSFVTVQRPGGQVPATTGLATTVVRTTALPTTVVTTATTTTTVASTRTTTVATSSTDLSTATATSAGDTAAKGSSFPVAAAVGVAIALVVLVIAAAGFAMYRRHQSKRSTQQSDLRKNFFTKNDGGKYNQFEMEDKAGPAPVSNKVNAWKPVEEGETIVTADQSSAGYYAYPAQPAAGYVYPAAAAPAPAQYYVAQAPATYADPNAAYAPADPYYQNYPTAYVVDPYAGQAGVVTTAAPPGQPYMYTYDQSVASGSTAVAPPPPALAMPAPSMPQHPGDPNSPPPLVPPKRMDVQQ